MSSPHMSARSPVFAWCGASVCALAATWPLQCSPSFPQRARLLPCKIWLDHLPNPRLKSVSSITITTTADETRLPASYWLCSHMCSSQVRTDVGCGHSCFSRGKLREIDDKCHCIMKCQLKCHINASVVYTGIANINNV